MMKSTRTPPSPDEQGALRDKRRGLFWSIRSRLFLSFMLVILLLLLINGIFIYIHYRIVGEYQEITDNLILENRFAQDVPEFIQSYVNVVNSPHSGERLEAYSVLKERIETTMSVLDTTIISKESQVSYRGLKNFVNYIVAECDKGVEDMAEGNITSAAARYGDVFEKKSFIAENTVNLIIKELAYAEMLQKDIEQTNRMVIVTGSASLLIIALFCILFAFMFSRRLTGPVIKLSVTAEEIADGNVKLHLDHSLMEKNDETGSLATSFEKMLVSLRSKMQQVVDARDELQRNQGKLEMANKDLLSANKTIEEFNTGLEQKVKERTQALEIATERIAKLLEMKNEFLNQVAHDLRTPLTPINLLMPTIKTKIVESGDSSMLERFDVIMNNLKYLDNLIKDTLDLSRLDAGKTKFTIAAVNIPELIKEIISNNQVVFDKHGIWVTNKVGVNIPDVMADKNKVLEILGNLITNAVKFIGENEKRITFDANVEEGFVTISVQDTGIGIEKGHHQNIFEPFYKVDQSRHVIGSSGLGLAICKKTIEAMGGTITVASEGASKGATFSFTLPLLEKDLWKKE